jgi:hypothetical protein
MNKVLIVYKTLNNIICILLFDIKKYHIEKSIVLKKNAFHTFYAFQLHVI